MKLDSYPLSAMCEGLRTVWGGALMFMVAVCSGTACAHYIVYNELSHWYIYPFASLIALFLAANQLWGLLLVPLYGLLFFGLIWREWSRLICVPILTMSTSLILLASFHALPLDDSGSLTRFLLTEGGLSLMLFFGLLRHRRPVPYVPLSTGSRAQ